MSAPDLPPVPETLASGMLPVGDGHEVYWETSGAPDGKPVVYLHGGPGGGMMTGYRRYADPARHLIVGVEQRGCGRSRPLVTDALDTLASQTTSTLIDDLERLREHLGLERWLVVGVSWGCTLALAYAQAHPDRVSEVVLMAVATTTPREVAWITESMGRLFPEAWSVFRDAAGARPGERLVDAYARLLVDPDPDVRARATQAWCDWEDVHVSLAPGHRPRSVDPRRDGVFATLVTHYWRHAAFLGDDQLLADMPLLADVPGVLVHGRLDVSGPTDVPWALHEAWPGSRLVVVETEGHGGPEMVGEVRRAVDSFAP